MASLRCMPKRRGTGWVAIAVACAASSAGCKAYNVPPAVGTTVVVGSTIGASVINRAVTGECYAVCSPGWYCDTASGLCEPAGKLPEDLR